MLRKLILTFFTVYVLCFTIRAQNYDLEYSQKLTISEGLAHNGVTCIFKDSKGFIWISTYDGLNRYDGYECTIYKNTLDKTYFVSNRIRTIAEDKEGNLWLGTDEGISIYNTSQEKYRTIYSNKNAEQSGGGPTVRKIFVNEQEGVIICATEGDGILVFNDDKSLKKQYIPPSNISSEPVLFFDGLKLDEHTYLYSTSIGIIQFDLNTGKFYQPFPKAVFSSRGIIKVTDNVVLATADRGVNVYSFEKLGDNKYSYKLLFEEFKDGQFTSATVDKRGNLWLGTAQRGIIHIKSSEKFATQKPYESAKFSSNSGFLRTSCFLATENFGCWVGTFNKGLFQFDLEQNPFKHFNSEMNQKYGLRTNEVLNLVTDKNKVYLSANSGGISLLNTVTGNYEPLPFDIPEEHKQNALAAFMDSHKHIWVRINNKIKVFKPENGNRNLETISNDSFPGFEDEAIRSMTEDKYGNIWLGCINNVYKLSFNKNRELEKVESLRTNSLFKNNKLGLVRVVYADPLYDFIWVGTDSDGFIRIKNEPDKTLLKAEVKQYLHEDNNVLSISSNFVSSAIRLPNSELWIGTERGGIAKVVNSESTPEFISYSEKNGLSNNVVKNILFDDEYKLWISTNIGLNKFDTKDFHFRTFGVQDGLAFEDFLYSAAKLENGNMLFCGSGGCLLFKPGNIKNNEELPKLMFGEFTLFNKTVLPGDKIDNRILFNHRVQDKNELQLKHDENVFSIELLSLHYSAPENHFLKYKLVPLNADWLEFASNQRVINYNGLQPGKYELQVMASNSLNEWTKPQSLFISIAPPFWVTPPAFILYFLFVGLLVYAIMHYLLRLNKLQHSLEIEQLEKDKVKEVNEAKLRFFSNISHEIKTPLTLISGPINLLAERFKKNDDVQDKLKIVQRQSRKMLRLVNQVHDFQRADANKLKMDYSTFCFDDFVNELIDDFKFKADNDKKYLIVDRPLKPIFAKADRDKLEKIFNNLLNNAFKFTKEGDTIKVDYKNSKNELIVKVSDTGRGIDAEDLPHIFERFYQSQKKYSEYTGGSGIGLAFASRLVEMHYGFISAESFLNNGSCFTVKLPVITSKTSSFEESSTTLSEILEVEKGFDTNNYSTESINPEDIKVAGDLSAINIFFAEDNTDMRTFVSGILSNFFKVKSFNNGEDCWNALENEWPDIVISDVLMPEMNGFDLCNKIKSDIKTSHIPVILLTACTTIEDNLKGLEVGADAYIKKPFNVQHLVTRIETLLRSRNKLRERFQIDLPLTIEKKNDNNDIAFLEKLYALMEDNLDNQNLDLDRFAKELYLNRTHFYQKVKALTNKTPFELLKSYRLKKAAELLVQKQISVNEVYSMTGFKSRTHFSKLFKEVYNVTPGKYAAEVLKNSDKQ